MQHTDWAERTRTNHYQPQPRSYGYEAPNPRQSFHHARTSLGAAGHLLHLGMVAAPLVIGEVIVDTEKKWRAMRMVPVLGAIASDCYGR